MEKDNKELEWYKKLSEKDLSSKNKKGNEHKLELEERRSKMSNQKKLNLEKFTMDANLWVDEVAGLMKVGERKDIAWNALRGVLHAIRDRLIPEEMFQLSAQLPMLIRGLFFEGYHYSNKPEKFHVEELKSRIDEAFGPLSDIDPEVVFKSVLVVLYDHVSEGELQDIYSNMPKDIQQLWDKSLKTYTV